MLEQQNHPKAGMCHTRLTPRSRVQQRRTSRGDSSLSGDMEFAKFVQDRLLPKRSLAFPGLQFETYYQPLHSIGGDYYDFLPLPEGKLGIAIGDVSGKGVGAALTMAGLQASLRAQLLHPHTDPVSLVTTLNRLLYASSPANVFASLFYGQYDPNLQLLTYVNAGHNPPLIVRANNTSSAVIRLEGEGLPVGVFAESEYREFSCPLYPGDLLLGYTDGITEARNPAGEQWGTAGLEALLSGYAGGEPAQTMAAILKGLRDFTGTWAVEDDLTMVVIGVEPRS